MRRYRESGVAEMGERRMFAKTIVTSDAFLDMPMSARCLYFTLGMFADDDGFVNNPKSIMRQVGATIDDMNILIGKKFILIFESGVIVIKHWRIHNYIQSDRYHPTKYQEEKATLTLDENKAYTQNKQLDTECIHDVSKADTEVKLSKDKRSKDIYKDVPEEIKEAFMEWVAMRKAIKKPITNKATVTRALNTLYKLSKRTDKQIAIINQSTDKCWQSFYELKTEAKPKAYKEFEKEPEYKAEEMPEELRQKLGGMFNAS